MNSPTFPPEYSPSSSDEREVIALYQQLLSGWNKRSAATMAETFADRTYWI